MGYFNDSDAVSDTAAFDAHSFLTDPPLENGRKFSTSQYPALEAPVRFCSSRNVLGIALALIVLATPLLAEASNVAVFKLFDHPNGNQNPPSYGLRLDGMLTTGEVYTFSFEYADGTGMADVSLTYDDGPKTIHISGRAYGGRDTGSGWDAAESGWIDIDFTYTQNVIDADNVAGDPGDDIYVLVADAANNGTISLDGWGGNVVLSYSDKVRDDFSFQFDNDADSKGNASIANDPTLWSGAGWLMGNGHPSTDWLFIGELHMGVPTEDTSWGQIKSQF